MNNMLKFSIIFFILNFLSQSCSLFNSNTTCPPDCSVDTTTYPLIINWESYFNQDSSYVLSVGTPVLFNDLVIYPFWTEPDHVYHIIIFNKISGEILKRFDLGTNTIKNIKTIANYLVVPSLDGITVIDLENLSIVKEFEGAFDSNLSVFDTKIFVPEYHGEVPYLDSSSIFVLDLSSFEIWNSLSISRKDYGAFSTLNPVSIDINMEGDMIFFGTMETDPWLLYCYNMTQDSFVWKTSVSGGDKYKNAPIIHSDQILITNDWGMEAYNKETGTLLWRSDLEGECGYRPCAPLVADNKIVLKECGYHLYCLNISDGSIIWHNENAGGPPSNILAYHGGYIYYGSQGNYLHIIDIGDGSVVLKTKSPYDNSDYLNTDEWQKFESIAPALDVEKGVFYFPDRLRMFSFNML